MVKLWADFATHGSVVFSIFSENVYILLVEAHKFIMWSLNFRNPTPNGKTFHWNKWTADRNCYLNISKAGLSMEEGFAADRYRFFKTLKYRDNMV